MEKVEYYTIKPNLKQIYGKKVFKDTEFTEKTEDGRVEQTFKDLTLTTVIHSENKNERFEVIEDSTLTIKVPEGTILLWSEVQGFIVPEAEVCTLEELAEEISQISDIYTQGGKENDIKGNED